MTQLMTQINVIYAPRITLLALPQVVFDRVPVPFLDDPRASRGERLCEFAGRNCYQSWSNPSGKTSGEYIQNIIKQGHGSVLEHANYTLFIEGISRSLTHEFVRHRAGFAYSQLSQRYVDESDTAFVCPPVIAGTSLEPAWREEMVDARDRYTSLSDALFAQYEHIQDRVHRRKTAREAARSVLPNATETKLVVTANLRAWRSTIELRASEGAEREIRRLFVQLLRDFKAWEPSVFADFELYTGEDGSPAARCTYHKV